MATNLRDVLTTQWLAAFVAVPMRASAPCSAKATQPVRLSGDKPDSISVEIWPRFCACGEQALFTLTTGWEARDELAFDAELSRVIVVSEGMDVMRSSPEASTTQ